MITPDNGNLYFSPYTWQKRDNGSRTARMPGAYLKFQAENTSKIIVWIDRAENAGCPACSMPVLEVTVNHGAPQVLPVPELRTGENVLYPVEALTDGDPGKTYCVEFNFRAADLTRSRWFNPDTHLTVAGVELSAGGRFVPPVLRRHLAIAFGDSITEGVGAADTFVSWNDLTANRSAGSWFPLTCAALDCEYGQLGTGGQGIQLGTCNMKALIDTWDKFTDDVSRLINGRLLPEPDYVFCAMGTNDFDQTTKVLFDITETALRWLTAVRTACPNAMICWFVPPLGQHDSEIIAAIQACREAGDRRVFRIDSAPARDGFDINCKPSRYAGDGIHPNAEGTGILAAIAAGTVRAAETGGK